MLLGVPAGAFTLPLQPEVMGMGVKIQLCTLSFLAPSTYSTPKPTSPLDQPLILGPSSSWELGVGAGPSLKKEKELKVGGPTESLTRVKGTQNSLS